MTHRFAGPIALTLKSLRETVSALADALKQRSVRKLVALVSEGSPLESFIQRALGLAFWVLIVAPILLVPVYYLILTLVR